MGVIGAVGSVWCTFTAKHKAMEMISGGGHHGKHGGQGHHGHKGGEMEMDGRGPHHPKPSPYVTREEFDMYDAIKTMSALSFVFFCKLIALGKCGKRVTWMNKSNVTKRVMKKSCLCLMLLVIVAMFCKMEGSHMKMIMKKVHPKKDHKQMEMPENRFEDDEEENDEDDEERFEGRNLRSYALFGSKLNEACSYADEDYCNAVNGCSWCKSAAVKAACRTME